jgi:Mrp family chromosome partitioning ATPase
MAQAGLTGSGDLLAFFAHPDNIELDSVIVADRATDLHVLGGTRQSETSTDQLFADQAFAHIMQSVTRAFDIVVLDTPPIGPVVDGVYLARYADSVLLVAKWAETPQGEIRAAAEALLDGLSDEVEVLAVLNQVSLPKSRHSSKYASYYSRG